jgi:hypothetical protein
MPLFYRRWWRRGWQKRRQEDPALLVVGHQRVRVLVLVFVPLDPPQDRLHGARPADEVVGRLPQMLELRVGSQPQVVAAQATRVVLEVLQPLVKGAGVLVELRFTGDDRVTGQDPAGVEVLVCLGRLPPVEATD